MTARTKRGFRPLAAATASLAVAVTGVVLGGTPTVNAAAAATCDTPFPVADLVPHQAVTGLTVSEGTTPDGFTGEVLGVVKNGIAPGLDMVMVRLTSTEIDRVGGIWAGMSGSPVYAEDGRLIGAVAYGLAWGPSPVAGVTPFEEMDNYLPTPPPPKMKIPDRLAARIAKTTDVTRAQAAQGFTQLPLAGGVASLSQSQLDRLTGRPKHQYTGMDLRSASVGTSAAASAADIVNGGNLGYAVSGGDIAAAAIGTVTSVCGDEVVGFGHPATYLGKVSAAMQPADAVYIQEDPVSAAFKVANLGAPVGTITEDHRTGITGALGATPDSFTVTSEATYGSTSRTGSSDVYVPEYGADTTLNQLYYNQDRVLDAMIGGSEQATWEITGTAAGGAPFTISVGEQYQSADDIAFEGVWDTPDFVWQLSHVDGLTIDSVHSVATFTDDETTWKVTGVSYKSKGQWVDVTKGGRIQAKAGGTIKLRVALTGSDGSTKNTAMSVAVPAKASGLGQLFVVGGRNTGNDIYGADTLAEIQAVADGWVRNDEISADLSVDGKKASVESTGVSAPQSHVVSGRKIVRVVVTP
ncbi:MAG: hypothetical protein U0R78_15595 [Nocardioidaceae bacterium]